MPTETYRSDYPTVPIGKGNPYHQCAHCRRSVPEINGRVLGHSTWCEWRLAQSGTAQHDTAEKVKAAFLAELGDLLGRWGAELQSDLDDMEVTIPAVYRSVYTDGVPLRPDVTINLGSHADQDIAND